MKKYFFMFLIFGAACSEKDDVTPTNVPSTSTLSDAVVLSSNLDGDVDNGTVYNTTAAAGIQNDENGALYFNGTNSYVDFGTSLSNDDISTISIWAKFDTLANGMPDMELVSKSSYREGLEIVLYNGKLSFYLVGLEDNNNIGVPISSLKQNTWYHIAAVHDQTNSEMKFYLNGELKASGRAPGQITEVNNLMLGNWSYQDNPRFFKGSLDNFNIYNRVLTDVEVLAIYQEGVAE